jgi:uncharacterized protein
MGVSRRHFVHGLVALPLASRAGRSLFGGGHDPAAGDDAFRLSAFDLREVRLLPGPLLSQYERARDFYFNVDDDAILKGFRESAGLPAPGNEMGGWCARDSSEVFGQWLSGMARIARAYDDTAIKNKATLLMTEWGRTLIGNNASGIAYYTGRKGHYLYDKNVGGLTDMALYAEISDAWPLLEKITDWAEGNLSRQRMLANSSQRQANFDGHSMEWYTLSENLYRAAAASGQSRYQAFGDVWRYDQYWGKFYDTAAPRDAYGVHAYSHLNTFNSAAMAYVARRDPRYLQAAENAFDYFLNTQCYATGGYGPAETLVTGNELGASLEMRSDSAECPCGAWGGLKLSQYLTMLTGQARFGDLAELLIYNVMLAALPMNGNGKTFYYADYRVGGGMKTYRWDTWPCCSGTYIQNVASYTNFIYYQDHQGLFVNLYVPSEVKWKSMVVRQTSAYPESDCITVNVQGREPVAGSLRFRIPGWCVGATIEVNGERQATQCTPGTWATIARTWKDGDAVRLTLPMKLRASAIDAHHPRRIAVMTGPVVLAQDGRTHARFIPSPDSLEKQLVAGDHPLEFTVAGGSNRFRPFYSFEENVPYWMYLDV